MRLLLIPVLLASGCALRPMVVAGQVSSSKSAICGQVPSASAGFRHHRNDLLVRLGTPRHRGVDLIAVEGDENQTLGGKLAYTAADKDLEDEDVEVFACAAGAWRPIGVTRTDRDGRFAMVLAGGRRLPVGMTDLYAHVPGDGSGARFVGFVAARGESVVVSDIDGTITASEKAIFKAVLLRRDIGHQAGAPQALARSGRTVVYVTARGDQYTELTRRWLRAHGFPPGPLRLASDLVTLPGKQTVELKAATLANLGVPIAAGIGNRASDVAAYRRAGLRPDQIFINLPEFGDELRAELAAGNAIAFDHYRELPVLMR